MRLLCISNGHGEDVIALRILVPLRQINPNLEIAALPISGDGSAYRSANLPIIGPTQTLPSGGFLNRDPKQLARDLQKGLVSLTRSQLSALKAWAAASTGDRDTVLAVGDIVPLLFAYLSGLPYSFVGTAKSEYWLRDERGKLPAKTLLQRLEGWSGSVYLPWERWLMSRDRAQTIFVRDALTAQHLQKLGISAQYAGNPMMDSLAPTGQLSGLLKALHRRLLAPNYTPSSQEDSPRTKATAKYVTQKKQLVTPLTVALIPGSRSPEAYENWRNLLAAVPGLIKAFPNRPLILLAALSPTLSGEGFGDEISKSWVAAELDPTYPCFFRQNVALVLVDDAYNDCMHEAKIAIATAGTATEQFVGLGKPAITLPGKGPQFTQTFATVQAKMLGPSIYKVESPDEIGPAIAKIISNPDRLQLIYQNGKQRMGNPGAGNRIAETLSGGLGEGSAPRQYVKK